MGGMGGILLLTLLGASISGVMIAAIAKFLLPGKQRVSGIEMFLIGTGAAWLGGIIAGLFGWGDGRGIHWGVLAIQVAIAAVAIWLWTDFRNKQLKQAVVPGPAKGKGDKNEDDDKDKGRDQNDKKGPGGAGPGKL